MIRPAAGADLPDVAILWQRYRDEANDHRFPERTDWERWILPRIAAGDVRVGTTDRHVAAYVAWQRSSPTPGCPRDLLIRELYVHPAGRGQRLGSGLLARAIDAARQRNCGAVAVVTNVDDAGVLALVEPFGFALKSGELLLQLQRG